MLPELITSCYGKTYRGEPAVISLTSWKDRINTVSKTIYNLFTVCPGFHICLVLAEDEFPAKESELPKQLIMMANAGVFEILWVKQNWKSFKKILFTMEKYRTVPIISADDDCLYKCNYAQLLFKFYQVSPNYRICFWCSHLKNKIYNTSGYATLHPPYFYKDAAKLLTADILELHEDDLLYAALCKKLNHFGCICLHQDLDSVVATHNEVSPLHDVYRNSTLTTSERFNKMLSALEVSINEHHWK